MRSGTASSKRTGPWSTCSDGLTVLDSFMDLVRRLGAPRVVGLLLVTGAGVGAMWALISWGNQPNYVEMAKGVPIDVISSVMDVLEDAEGVDPVLSPGGASVLVPVEQAAAARVELAGQGLSAGERPGFELFDEPSWGMTDFTQRINYRRALEGELERSITQMRGIRSADVHLALQEGSIYQRAGQPVEASVLLGVSAGARPTSQQVEAITFLLASAVDGLSSESVSVVDDAGRVLSSATEPNSTGRMDRRRLEMQLELENYLEDRVSEMLEPVVGAANVRVRVSAQLNHEQVERRTDSVDPNQQVLTDESRSEIEPGDPSQGASSSIQNNTFDVTRSTEVSTRVPGEVTRLTVAVALNEDFPRAGDAALVQRIESLVSNAVGIDLGRGDRISVLAVPFETPPPVVSNNQGPTTSVLDIVREFQRPIILLIALGLAFALAMRGLTFARTALPEPAPLLPLGSAPRQSMGGADGTVGIQGEGGEAIVGGPQIDASRVVRAWLGEG